MSKNENASLVQNPCPSTKCWDFNSTTGKCTLRTNQNCYSVTCEADKIVVTFIPELFGSSVNTFSDGLTKNIIFIFAAKREKIDSI